MLLQCPLRYPSGDRRSRTAWMPGPSSTTRTRSSATGWLKWRTKCAAVENWASRRWWRNWRRYSEEKKHTRESERETERHRTFSDDNKMVPQIGNYHPSLKNSFSIAVLAVLHYKVVFQFSFSTYWSKIHFLGVVFFIMSLYWSVCWCQHPSAHNALWTFCSTYRSLI